MACGFGACFGCAVPKPEGGYLRLCVDGPVVLRGDRVAEVCPCLSFCGIELAHPVINASGTYDAIAARRVFGDDAARGLPLLRLRLEDDHAGAARRQRAAADLGDAGGDDQLDRAAEQGPGGIPRRGPAAAGRAAGAADRLGDGDRAGEEFARLVEAVGAREEVAAIELNVSCPNVHSGLIVGEQPTETEALLEALRPLTAKPLIVKLTPNVADPAAVAVAAEEGGADAVSLINTLKASAIDPASGEPALAAGHGGLSGPAVRPIALAAAARRDGRRAVCR